MTGRRRRNIILALALLLLAALLGWWRHSSGTPAAASASLSSRRTAVRTPSAARPSVPTVATAVAAANGGALSLPMPPVTRGPFTLVEHTPERLRIRFELPEYHVEEVTREDGTTWQSVVSDAPGLISVAGAPSLPAWRTDIALPPGWNGQIQFHGGDSEFLADVIPPPGTGSYHRPEEPPANPVPSPVYYDSGIWPAQTATVVAQYQLRDVAGLGISVTPFQYDADRGGVIAMRSGEIVIDNPAGRLARLDDNFDSALVQRLQFLNGSLLRGGAVAGIASEEAIGRLLMVVPDAWRDNASLAAFVAWKQSLGIAVQIAGYPAETGAGRDNLKAYLQEAFDDAARNFTHLMLVGDYAAVPPGRYSPHAFLDFPSDTPYALLAGEGDTEYMDAFLARLPVSGETALAGALERLMETEAGAPQEAWPGRGLFLAGDDNSAPGPYPGILDANIKDCEFLALLAGPERLGGLLTSIATLFPSTIPAPTGQDVADRFNEGPSLMFYLGHGLQEKLAFPEKRPFFNVARARTLANGARRPFCMLPVCDIANMSHAQDKMCLVEALMNPDDGDSGAAAVIAATDAVTWHPPMVMLDTFAKLLRGEMEGQEPADARSAGTLFLIPLNESINYCETYSNAYPDNYYYDHTDAVEYAHLMHLFGDPTAIPRITPYRNLAATVDADEDDLIVTVTADAEPVEGTAVCYAAATGEVLAGHTDGEGHLRFQDLTPEQMTGLLRIADPAGPIRQIAIVAGEVLPDEASVALWLETWRERMKAVEEDGSLSPAERAAARQDLLKRRSRILAHWRETSAFGQGDAQVRARQEVALAAGWSPLVLSLYPDSQSYQALAQACRQCYGWNGRAFAQIRPETPGVYFVDGAQNAALTLNGLRDGTPANDAPAGWRLMTPRQDGALLADNATAFAITADNGALQLRRLNPGDPLEKGVSHWLWTP